MKPSQSTPKSPATFAAWWKGYVTRTLMALPWVEEIARDAFNAGRRSVKR